MSYKNPEKRRECDRRWKERNKEKIRKYFREWWMKNKDRYKEHKRVWRKKNRDKIREYFRKWYRVRKKALKVAAFKSLGEKCCKCGIDDHRVLQVNHLDSRGPYRTGAALYKEVLKDPSRFNLMCAVCHTAYHFELRYRIKGWEIKMR